MDKRTAYFAVIALIILCFLARETIINTINKWGGMKLEPGDDVTVTLPSVDLPALPAFKPGPSMWTQTTGLMCACDVEPFTSPVLVREITVPKPPQPGYRYSTPTIQEQAQKIQLTYTDFGLDSSYAIWGAKPYESVYRGSDGRMFLKPKVSIWGVELGPNLSQSNNFIGTDEYSIDQAGVISYGPYEYRRQKLYNIFG